MIGLVLLATLAAAPVEARPLLITVDDLPIAAPQLHPTFADRKKITEGLLAVLKKHRIRAVGLVTWSRVLTEQDRTLLDRWLAEGHELGNHSFGHLSLTREPTTVYLMDIDKGRDQLASYLALRNRGGPRFFRFPFLEEGDTVEKLRVVRQYLDGTKQRNLPVTIDNQDWSYEKPFVEGENVSEAYHEALHTAVRRYEERGDRLADRRLPQILLLHANAVGAAEWDRLFTWLETHGHRFATVDEVLADPIFAAPHEYVGENGPSLWERLIDRKAREKATAEVRAVIERQVAAWNRGDAAGVCAPYAEDALVNGPGGSTRGREALLALHSKRLAGTRGTLSYELVETRLAKGMEYSYFADAVPSRTHGATVAVRWTLAAPGKAPVSTTSLIALQPRQGAWLIVQAQQQGDAL